MKVPGESSEHESSRRNFLRMTIAGTVAGLALDMDLSQPKTVLAQSTLTPDEALQALVAGNQRFVSGHSTAHQHDMEILKQKALAGQEPFAAVLSCADSRVPLELIFDQSIGHLFVVRIAGNMVTPEVMGSLEYGAAVLGTKVILVVGHAQCGAVKATIQGTPVPGQIGSLFPHIQPAVEKAGPNLEAATKANAEIQADLLRTSSPVLEELIKQGKLKVASGYYNIASGAVTLLD